MEETIDFSTIGKQLIKENIIINWKEELWIFKDRYYKLTKKEIERMVLTKDSKATSRKRYEIYKYLFLITEELEAIASPYKVPCLNGYIDLKELANGSQKASKEHLRPYTSDEFFDWCLPINYTPINERKEFDDMLDVICENDADKVKMIQEMIGYSVMNHSKYQKAFLIYGAPGSGKSTLLNCISSMFGRNNMSALSLNDLNRDFALGSLVGKKINLADDIADAHIKDSSNFKKIVSGDSIEVNRKNKDFITTRLSAKLVYTTNNLPTFNDKSGAVQDRLVTIPLNANLRNSDSRDTNIGQRLQSNDNVERVLMNAIEGAIRLINNNGKFSTCKDAKDMLEQFNLENNNVLSFITDNKEWMETENRPSTKQEVYDAYRDYCLDGGIKSLSKNNMHKQIHKITGYEVVPASIRKNGHTKTMRVYKKGKR